MSQHAFTFAPSAELGTLMVREAHGEYRAATPDEILSAARQAVDQRYMRGTKFDAPDLARSFFSAKLAGLEREVFAVAFLDTRHRLIAYSELFAGSIDGSEVHAREVVKEALRHNCAAILVAHNHPSGTPEPSAADRAVTAKLKQALALVDVRLLDHIIVGGNETVSMASRGLV